MKPATPTLFLLSAATVALLISMQFARGQQAPQPPAPDFTITLNGREWFFIGEALADKPFRDANPILSRINQQISAIAMQRQKEADEKAKADAEKAKAEAEKAKPAEEPKKSE